MQDPPPLGGTRQSSRPVVVRDDAMRVGGEGSGTAVDVRGESVQ